MNFSKITKMGIPNRGASGGKGSACGRRVSGGGGRGGKGSKGGNSSSSSSSKNSTPKEMNQKIFMCLQCEVPVDEGEDCVQCYDCKQWYHFDCTDLTQKYFELLTNTDNSIQWLCNQCKDGERQRRDEKDDKLDFLIKKLEMMEEKLTKLEGGYTGDTLEEKIDKAVERKLAEALDERSEIEKRKLNVIVVGLEESEKGSEKEREEEDMRRLGDMITKIDTELKETDIEDLVRLGKKNDRPRLIRFKTKTQTAKDKIIKNYYKLNDGKRHTDRIYFNPDLTPLQRQKQRQLRKELDEKKRETGENDWTINYRTGEIVKKKPASSDNKTCESSGQGKGAH